MTDKPTTDSRTETKPPSAWQRLSLSARILIGLGLGIFAGLFFGESAKILDPIAEAYIRLMQMTVLPYLVVSLIVAFGQLEPGEAKRLAWRGGGLLVLIWIIMTLIVITVPLSFPVFEAATFFSDAIVQEREAVSFTEIYFTSNPFDSLSRNVVPAVVLFSCLVGIGLMQIENKEKLLEPLRIWNAAVVRITGFVINLTPYGVFAIGAVTAGTMDPDVLLRLEVYFIGFAVASVLLAFWILPLLVTAVTPFSYREVSGIARDALLTAFMAHSAFIVLPILAERSKELLEKHGLLDESADSATEVLIPVMFNFPNAGKLLTLLFIPFAAWLAGAPLAGMDFATLMSAGIPSYFAKAQIAIPFLLDLFSLPHDLFQLYIPTTILNGKFDSLVAAMNLLVFALLGAGAMGGFLVFDKIRILRALAGIAGGIFAMVVVLKLAFAWTIDTSYHMDEAIQKMHRADRAPSTIVHRMPPLRPELTGPAGPEQIRARGALHIGYDPDNLPMSFFNDEGDLVGFDVELGEALARDMQVRAEFVPIDWSDLPGMLARGEIDVMPGMWVRPYWFSSVLLSKSYYIGTVGLVVLDQRRHEFDTLDKLAEAPPLKVGVPLDASQLTASMQRYFGRSDVEYVTIETWKPFFEGEYPDLDAFLLPAEHASAWTLLHPEYTVVVPQPNPVRIPWAFGMAPGNAALEEFVNEWVVYVQNTELGRSAFNYWIRGQGAEPEEPRWSIMRNVLGWSE